MLNFIEKYSTYIGIGLVIIILIGVGLLLWNKKETADGSKVTAGKIRVDIEGAVAKPGVYELKDGSILEDVLKLSGGFSDKVDAEKVASEINRARLLVDGEKILIPVKGQVAGTGTEESQVSGEVTGKINLNTATIEQLDKLPGIGPAYAQRIIDYRTQNDGFKSIEEIQEVKGIGPKTFEKFKDQITI